jgi:acyl CoA:acetate/3-ketoacid CoA transferase alpha subunit
MSDSLDILRLLVRDADIEFFFEFHNQLNSVKAVCSQIVLEAGLRGDLCFVHAELVDNDLNYFFLDASHNLLAFNEQLRRQENPDGQL